MSRLQEHGYSTSVIGDTTLITNAENKLVAKVNKSMKTFAIYMVGGRKNLDYKPLIEILFSEMKN